MFRRGQPTTSASVALVNLLHLANGELGQVKGECMSGIDAHLSQENWAAKIRRWEFIDMGELLPDFWSPNRDEDAAQK